MSVLISVIIMLFIGFSNTLFMLRIKTKIKILQMTALLDIPLLSLMLVLFNIPYMISIVMAVITVGILEVVYCRAIN